MGANDQVLDKNSWIYFQMGFFILRTSMATKKTKEDDLLDGFQTITPPYVTHGQGSCT